MAEHHTLLAAHRGVQHLFQQRAAAAPSSLALDAPRRQLSYRQLEQRSNRLASCLLQLGTRRGDRVAILAEDSVEIVTSILASLKLGAVFVPLDPASSAPGREQILVRTRPRFVLVERGLEPHLESEATSVTLDGELLDRGEDCELEPIEVGGDDPCYIYFTSGSTGEPKGIVGRLRGIDHFVRWQIETFGIDAETRVSQFTHPTFDAYLRDVFTPLCAGGTVVIPPRRDLVADARSLARWLDEARIHVVHCVPTVFRTLLAEPLEEDRFSALRTVFLAGEVLHPADVAAWRKIFGDRIELVNLYGQSETTMTKFFHRVSAEDAERPVVPIGRPMPGAAAILVDRHLRPTAPGAVGEILLRTPFRSLGYLDQPQLSASVFIDNPFNKQPGDVVYRTGDQARQREDGAFEFVGRRDQQVKVRGVRVELGEVERLVRQHPAVVDAAVVARQDPAGNTVLAAYVVVDGGDPAALKVDLAASLGAAALPSVFVALEELPRTASGKVDRHALARGPLERDGAGGASALPRSGLEQTVAEVFQEVLGIARVGRAESLFELGGHSLTATRLASRLRAVLDIDVPLQSVIAEPTIAGLAREIERRGTEQPSTRRAPLTAGARGGTLPSSPLQQRQAVLGEASAPLYLALRLSGAVETTALQRALRLVGERHEVLRTVFTDASGSSVELSAPPWREVEAEEMHGGEEDLRRLVSDTISASFDLFSGPLTRARLLRLDDTEHALVLVFHRAIADGWSLELLFEECFSAYRALLAGEDPRLPEVSFQYPDYALWQRRCLEEELDDEALAHWRKLLADPAELHFSATDRARPAALADSVHLTLPAALVERTRELGREVGSTLFTTLTSVFGALVEELTGAQDLLILAPVAQRDQRLLERLAGPVLNHLPLRFRVEPGHSFEQLVAAGRRAGLEAWKHQDLPFEDMLRRIDPQRWQERRPAAQLLCNYQHVAPRRAAVTRSDLGLQIRPLQLDERPAVVDLQLHLSENAGEVAARFDLRRGLAAPSKIVELGERFVTLLETAIDHPETPIATREAS